MTTQLITLKHGFMVAGAALKDLVIREPNLGDLMAAENVAPIYNQMSYRVALACQCIESLDGYDGTVTLSMMKSLTPADWRIISKALEDMERKGKE